jgi:hypothetical protein
MKNELYGLKQEQRSITQLKEVLFRQFWRIFIIMKELKKRFETPLEEKKYNKSPGYKALEYKINKVFAEMSSLEPQSTERQKLEKKLKSLRKERLNTTALKNSITRIEYVRYADDWMIGVSGDRKLALQIKELIADFLENTLVQKLHPTKTKVSDLRKGNLHFLGYEIFLPQNRPISSYKGKGVRIIRRGQPNLRFDVLVAKVAQRS